MHHVYVLDDGSTDNTAAAVRPFVESGFASFTDSRFDITVSFHRGETVGLASCLNDVRERHYEPSESVANQLVYSTPPEGHKLLRYDQHNVIVQ